MNQKELFEGIWDGQYGIWGPNGPEAIVRHLRQFKDVYLETTTGAFHITVMGRNRYRIGNIFEERIVTLPELKAWLKDLEIKKKSMVPPPLEESIFNAFKVLRRKNYAEVDAKLSMIEGMIDSSNLSRLHSLLSDLHDTRELVDGVDDIEDDIDELIEKLRDRVREDFLDELYDVEMGWMWPKMEKKYPLFDGLM